MALRFNPEQVQEAGDLELPKQGDSLPFSQESSAAASQLDAAETPVTVQPSAEEKLTEEQSLGRQTLDLHLDNYARTQAPNYLRDFRSLVRTTSRHNEDGELHFFLCRVLNFGPFETEEARRLFLQQVLPVLFYNITKGQLAYLFCKHGTGLPVFLLALKEASSLGQCLSLFQQMLQEERILPRQYEDFILSPQILQELTEQKEPDVNLTRVYLNHLSPVLQAGVVQWRLSDYLRLLSCAELEIHAYEADLIQARLAALDTQFKSRNLTKADYLAELSTADRLGRSPLQLFLATGKLELIRKYFKSLSEVANSAELEALFRTFEEGQDNCLHGLANSGSLEVLYCFIDFAIQRFGKAKAATLLKDLADKRNGAEQQPSYPDGVSTHPMNQTLALLRKGKAVEAARYLSTVLNASYSSFFSSAHSMLFFTGSPCLTYERQEAPFEFKENEVFLPWNLP